MDDTLIQVKNLQISFKYDGVMTPVIRGVSFDIKRGETLGMVGESGSGKSVTSREIMRLIATPPARIDSGEILFEGRDILKMSDDELRSIRGNRISMIFQEPMTSLNPVYPVGRQVAEVLRLHRGLDRKAAKARTVDLFHQVGIPDPAARYGAYPRQLSGGLRQRVMIAMAMACEPELLIADEPTTALDATIQAQILRLMGDLRRDHGTAILLITHNMGVVAQLCDYVYVMYAGQIVEAAETFDLFRTPRHPYTAGLLRAIPSLEGAQERLYTIPGTVPAPGAPHPGCRFCPRCDQGEGDCAASPPPLTHLGGGHLVRCHHPR